jgi:photosystem I protein
LVFVKKSLKLGENTMTMEAKYGSAKEKVGAEVAKTGAKAPFPFRTSMALILLAGNILVAAIYFHLINP